MSLNTLKEWLFLKNLNWKTRPAPVIKYLQSKKIKRTDNCSHIDTKKIRAAACQLELRLLTSPLEYMKLMYEKVSTAAKEGAQLVVFPENNTFQLLGMLPGIEEIGEKAGSTGGEAPAIKISDIFRAVGPMFNRTAGLTFSHLAKAFGLYIMAGSCPTPEKDKVFNRSYLFDPDGNLVGYQDKVHLMPVEHEWGLSQGSSFQVYPTPLGKLSMPVCMDATYFETFRILEQLGAEIVMIPIFNPEPYNYWLALRGIWPRVQESLVYGIKSAMVGNLLGYTVTGRAGIFAPLELTPNNNGVLAEAESPNREAVILADINLDALKELKKNHPYLGDRNDMVQKKYFPDIYKIHGKS